MSGLQLARLQSGDVDFAQQLDALLDWDLSTDNEIVATATKILARVRAGGDAALLDYTAQFDGVNAADLASLTLGPGDFATAFASLSIDQRKDLQMAADRVRAYHGHQRIDDWEIVDNQGHRLGQKVTAIERVGLYVPGGQAAYPSSVLMSAIPAKVAGVEQLVMTVPTPQGVRNPWVFAAAHVAGVDIAFTVGGAQAIGALAYGTTSIPKVDKIVGPGGSYVAAAKRLVFGAVGIEMIAGPSEILIVADGSVPAHWLALDLFSQAEHDAASQALLLSPDAQYLDVVYAEMSKRLADQPRREIILESLNQRGALILTRDMNDAVAIANRVAPEHLQLAVAKPRALLPGIRHAGAIFLGARSAEVLGDYVAGPSHVLPTFGTARFSSPLGVYDFVKRSSVIEISREGVDALARTAASLAEGEGLSAHAAAALVRIEDPR